MTNSLARGRTAVALLGAMFLAMALLAPGALGANPLPREGSFQAQWSVEGSRELLELGPSRSASIFRHSGTVTVVRSDGLVGNALSKCIGMGDSSEGDVSRCVWIDSRGERIFSELRAVSSPNAQTGRGRGQITGGTGRFEGLSGGYELEWVAVPSLDETRIEARTLKMRGRWTLP
jgi:hypothetical protein